MKALTALARQSLAGLRLLIVATLVLGIAYPLLVTGIAQVTMPWQANGSLVSADGSHTTDPDEAVGSELIGQPAAGKRLFYPRPSAAGDGYDMLSTAGTNLGPEDRGLIDSIGNLKEKIAAREGVSPDDVPADAVTASASGLDPGISPEYAELQVPRVAAATGLSEDQVQELVDDATTSRGLGVLGAPTVNVLKLNLNITQATLR